MRNLRLRQYLEFTFLGMATWGYPTYEINLQEILKAVLRLSIYSFSTSASDYLMWEPETLWRDDRLRMKLSPGRFCAWGPTFLQDDLSWNLTRRGHWPKDAGN